eukprot:546452-Amphidinium_carterae.1
MAAHWEKKLAKKDYVEANLKELLAQVAAKFSQAARARKRNKIAQQCLLFQHPHTCKTKCSKRCWYQVAEAIR